MKNVFLLALATVFTAGVTFAGNPVNDRTTYQVDTRRSEVFWTGKKVTGEHNGSMKISEGSVTTANGKPVAMTVLIDMNSIVNHDLKDETYNAKLVNHLKSEDFFHVEKHPTATFVATNFSPIETAKDRDPNYTVTGKLTIKGKTEQIEFPAYISENNNLLVASAKLVFDRSKFDVRYGSESFFGSLGDKAIYDEVDLHVVISARAE